MKIGIIGAGFGGLALAYTLSKKGVDVTVFESGEKPGGLAIGFKKPGWEWTLEQHYHHWFTNDDSVLSLAKEIGHEVVTVRPKTSTFVDNEIYQLDSPISLLKFSKMSVKDRFRTGAVLGYLKLLTNWKPLEKVTAKEFLIKNMGIQPWEILWRPLFEKKFGKYASKVPAAWFWARIKKRTPSLAYPEGGFLRFAEALDVECGKNKAKIHYKTIVKTIKRKNGEILVNTGNSDIKFDKIVVTLPGGIFAKITEDLPSDYVNQITKIKGLGAVNLVLVTEKEVLSDGTYWLNVNERKYPFLAVVEHTNFMDKSHYSNDHLTYLGNYLPLEHKYFQKDALSLTREFLPYLNKISTNIKAKDIKDAFLFKAPFAQPIIPLNYSRLLPSFDTPIPGIYLCNMSQVYPWDRGTNYAVENGVKLARKILNEI